MLLLALE
jgi:hypothetical protein